ncbi:MAG: hypothetical protein LCH53_11640 [Bacteroidetes bacterium]|nr:hypothetical protein [Bacteroidota bacterium]
MSTGSSVPYRLRPNKSVDRELFLALLARLAAQLRLEECQYIGLGGAFLEDFRLVHARIGIKEMFCLESEEDVHMRQNFNKPIGCITCIHQTIEDYIDTRDFEKPVILWLDYTEPSSVAGQIERFARTVGVMPTGSILRVTLNANPSSLGDPDPAEVAPAIGNLSSDRATKPTIQEWRLERLRERLGRLFPNSLTAADMPRRKFGKSLLQALHLAVENEMLSHRDREVVWALCTHYADGQPMVTATVVICEPGDTATVEIVEGWEFCSTPTNPHLLDMPTLSTMERLTMESADDPRVKLGFNLPKSDMGADPFDAFCKFYRIYPHFSRVEM